MVPRDGLSAPMVDAWGKVEVLRELARRSELTEMERAAVLEAAALMREAASRPAVPDRRDAPLELGCLDQASTESAGVHQCCTESTGIVGRGQPNSGVKTRTTRGTRSAVKADGRGDPSPGGARSDCGPSAQAASAVVHQTSSPGAVEAVEAVLFSDGASRGNPGPAGIGAVLEMSAGQRTVEISEYIGLATNNVAEYRALLAGLERALELGIRRLEVRADSELMIRQLRGEYQVKSASLLPLFQHARRLMGRFQQVILLHVRRELNTRADELANVGIDSAR
ncbi:ribonuclease HI family protein [Myxococcota bacterium]